MDKTKHVPERRAEIAGKLKRLVLNNLNFDLAKEGRNDGSVRIQTRFEVGLNEAADSYYVAVNIDVTAKAL